MSNVIPVSDLKEFVHRISSISDDLVLILVIWSGSGGITDYVLFSDLEDLAHFVSAAPISTCFHVFPDNNRPDVVLTPRSVQDVRELFRDANLPDQQEFLVVEIKKPSKGPGDHWSGLPVPRCFHATNCAEEYSDPPKDEELGFEGEEYFVGKETAFYRTAPAWYSDMNCYEFIVGGKPGAY